MDRVAFSIFGIDVMWYGILMASGMILGTLIALKEAKNKCKPVLLEPIMKVDVVTPEDSEDLDPSFGGTADSDPSFGLGVKPKFEILIKSGDTVVVLGCGPIGLTAIKWCLFKGK